MIPLLAVIKYIFSKKVRVSLRVYKELSQTEKDLVMLEDVYSKEQTFPFHLVEAHKKQLLMIIRRVYGSKSGWRCSELLPEYEEESLISNDGELISKSSLPYKFKQELKFSSEIHTLLSAIRVMMKEYLIFESFKDIDVETKTEYEAKVKGIGVKREVKSKEKD